MIHLTDDQRRAARNLETVATPEYITRVDGCDCGGSQMHRTDCTIWAVPLDARMAAVAAAELRVAEFTAALTAELRRAA